MGSPKSPRSQCHYPLRSPQFFPSPTVDTTWCAKKTPGLHGQVVILFYSNWGLNNPQMRSQQYVGLAITKLSY